jgi:hypothetical protein
VSFSDGINGAIDFNICDPLRTTTPECTDAFACLTVNGENGTLSSFPLSGKDFQRDILTSLSIGRTNDTEEGGLTLTYAGSSYQPGLCYNNKTVTMNLELLCNPDGDRDMDNNDVSGLTYLRFDVERCSHDISLKSEHACYLFSTNSFFRYLEKYWYIFGSVMIFIGLLVGFVGSKLIRPTLCVVGTVAFIGVSSLTLFSIFFTRNSSQVAEWIVFGVCCLVGVFIGLLLAYLSRFGTAVLAAWGGVALALMLYTSFMYKWDNSHQILYWIWVVGMGLATGVLGYLLYNHAVIIATAVVGAFLLIRGISFYAGGFPDIALVIEQIKHGQTPSFNNAFYGYLAGFIVSSIGFLAFQYKMFYASGRSEHPYHKYA